ncbi:MAG: YebC/PmpR family DNA-binding transcriptional regulator [Gammaproteobacteria bacterium]|nr:MAG: YebC/PmpR family DNA-binding transcriptional regulator [Gammaproteobacteria bacterium]
MAGHSKWANIQHRKKKQDNKRGKVFTKIIREITVTSRMGGSDMTSNPRLRLAVDKALGANMPKDTIERATKRGAGELEGVQYAEVRYEGYGPCSVAFMVDCLTDNRNRTVAEIRHAFLKHNGELATAGSVAFLFNKQGHILYPPESDEDKIMEIAIDNGATDVITEDDNSITVICNEESFFKLKEELIKNNLNPTDSDITMQTTTSVDLNQDDATKVLKLIETLEDLDDTQDVWTNANIPDEFFDE